MGTATLDDREAARSRRSSPEPDYVEEESAQAIAPPARCLARRQRRSRLPQSRRR
jgi:hypothetical protein